MGPRCNQVKVLLGDIHDPHNVETLLYPSCPWTQTDPADIAMALP